MSLLPLIFRDMAHMVRPLRMLENHMRMTEELLQPFALELSRIPRKSLLELKEQPEDVVHDKDKFQVKLDVQNFAPGDITVKTIDGNAIQVEAKHEKREESGYISRQMVRKFVLPHGHEVKDVSTTLSTDGILTIVAPRKIDPALEEKVLKIDHVGPERPIEEKKKDS